nr:metallophosphoesterase [Geomicrobium sp. JCM 19055]
MQQLVKKVNRLNADAIALVGDVMEDNIEPLKRNKMFDELSHLKSKLGTFVVLGNHEFYGQDVEEYIDRMKEANFSLLRDDIVYLGDSISIIGRKDAEDPTNRKLAKQMIKDVSRERFGIVLDHQPLDLEELSTNDHIDLVFSGHTHRGQVSPLHYVTNKKFPLDYGIKTHNGTSMIVSSGFGTWGPPIRLGSRSEIRFVDVRFQRASS